jgi:hypothetical protein
MLSTIHEVNTNMPFASHNASDFGKSLARELDHKVYTDLKDAGLDELAISGDLDNEVMETLMNMHQLDENGKPIIDKITGMPKRIALDEGNTVHRIAKIIQDVQDYMYNLLNENGANVEYRANRGVGQWLRADMLQSVELDEVIEDFRKWLHPESFGKMEGLSPLEAKAKQYSTIKKIIENYIEVEDGLFHDVVGKQGITDDYLAKYEGTRKLRYKDSNSVMQAMKKYGSGKLLSNVSNSSYATSKTVGLMSRYGADPDLGYSMLRKHVVNNYAGKVEDIHEKVVTADNAYRHARGLMNRTGTSTTHDIATGIMAHTRVTKYGAIGLSALKDVLPSIFALRTLTGRNSLVSAGKLFKNWIRKIPAAERQASAKRAGLVLETHLNQKLRRYAEENSDPRALNARLEKKFGKTGKYAGKYINDWPEKIQKISGINPITDANRTTFTDALSLEFADMTAKSFDELYDGTKRGFKRAGISAEDWEILRKLPIKDTFGLNIETIASAPDSYFPDMATKKRLHKSMKMLMYDWANTASPTGGLREDKIFGVAALDPNSIIHNVLRLVSVGMRTPIKGGNATLKILYNQLGIDDLGNLVKSKAFYAEAMHMAMYATTTTYMIEQLRNIISGRDMDDPSDYKTWIAMMQSSGALGIYGDILLSQSNKFSTDPSRSLVGPGFGTIDDIIKGISDPSLKALLKQLPMNNWYIMPLLKKQLLEEAAGNQ